MDKRDNYFNTLRWTLTVGVNAGYQLTDQEAPDLDAVSALFQEIITKEAEKSGVWITAVLSSSRTIYLESAGCPPEGEYTCTFSGSCNPEFTETDAYLPALKRVVHELKERLHQTTALLEIVPAHLDYDREA